MTRGGADNSKGRAARFPFAILVTALIVGGLVLLLVLNTFSAANELRRHDLASRDASVAAQVQELENEVADSAAPANLAAAAVALGMVPAGNPAFLVLNKDGSVQVMGSAAPATPAVVDIPKPPAAPHSNAHSAEHGAEHSKKNKKDDGKKPAKHDGKKSKKDGKKKDDGTTKNKKDDQTKHDGKKNHEHDGKKHDGKHAKKADPKPHRHTPTSTPTLTLPGTPR
jgi:hypothetical protein